MVDREEEQASPRATLLKPRLSLNPLLDRPGATFVETAHTRRY